MDRTIPHTHTVTDGPWTYTRVGWGATYTATHADTGETFDTGETSIPDVRRLMYARERAERAAAREAADRADQPAPVYVVQRGRVSTASPTGRRPTA